MAALVLVVDGVSLLKTAAFNPVTTVNSQHETYSNEWI